MYEHVNGLLLARSGQLNLQYVFRHSIIFLEKTVQNGKKTMHHSKEMHYTGISQQSITLSGTFIVSFYLDIKFVNTVQNNTKHFNAH